jgi:23S rRNA G2445 N2-methylase RlmL
VASESLATWERLRADAEQAAEAALRETWPPVVCADIDGKALVAARQNAAAASVDDGMVFEQADVATLERRWPAATLATNPPYGERLKPAELEATYTAMGRAFERLGGWRVIVLSGNPATERAIRRKPNVSHRLWNGALEARLLRYDF